MSITFKKFTQFVSLPDDHTDEQISEIFGLFKNNEKLDKLKAQRAKLKKDTAQKVADWRAKKEADAAAKDEDQPKNIQLKRTPVPPGYATPRAAAAGRAAERDWLGGMNEERKDFMRITMKMVIDAMGGEDKVKAKFKGKTAEEVADAMDSAAKQIEQKYKARETEMPEYYHFLTWADNYFNAA